MKRRMFTVIAIMVITFVPLYAQSENDFEIRQNAQGGITITGYTGNIRQVVIPATISGLRVTEIAANAFSRSNLTAITIPNGVTAIGDFAFVDSNYGFHRTVNSFQELIIPDSVARIGNFAFAYCGIQNINLGNGLQYIGGGAFNGNAIEDLVIPDSVTEIFGNILNSGTFANCGIKTLKLGARLAIIGEKAFADNMITELTFPASLKTIGGEAFSRNKLTTLVIPNGVRYIAQDSWGRGPFHENPITSINIPPSLAPNVRNDWDNSGNQGFAGGFTRLPITSITLPANVSQDNLTQFGESFINFWNLQGKKAGTYILNGRIWTVQ